MKCVHCKYNVSNDEEDKEYKYHLYAKCSQNHQNIIHQCCKFEFDYCPCANLIISWSFGKEHQDKKFIDDIKKKYVNKLQIILKNLKQQEFETRLGKKLKLLEEYCSFGFHECGFRPREGKYIEWEKFLMFLKGKDRIDILDYYNIKLSHIVSIYEIL